MTRRTLKEPERATAQADEAVYRSTTAWTFHKLGLYGRVAIRKIKLHGILFVKMNMWGKNGLEYKLLTQSRKNIFSLDILQYYRVYG